MNNKYKLTEAKDYAILSLSDHVCVLFEMLNRIQERRKIRQTCRRSLSSDMPCAVCSLLDSSI